MMASRINKEECRALRADGWSLGRLAERYGVTCPAISNVCRGVRCKIDHNREHLRGLHRSSAEQVSERKAQVRKLYAAGLRPKQIAYDTGISVACVYSYLPLINSPLAHALRRGGSQGAQPCA